MQTRVKKTGFSAEVLQIKRCPPVCLMEITLGTLYLFSVKTYTLKIETYTLKNLFKAVLIYIPLLMGFVRQDWFN